MIKIPSCGNFFGGCRSHFLFWFFQCLWLVDCYLFVICILYLGICLYYFSSLGFCSSAFSGDSGFFFGFCLSLSGGLRVRCRFFFSSQLSSGFSNSVPENNEFFFSLDNHAI